MNRFRGWRVIVGLVATSVTGSAHAQTILRVKADAPAGGNGATWGTAYNTLGAALAASTSGTEVWVAQGTYPEASGRAAFSMGTGVRVYGGFVGNESDRSRRQPSVHITTLTRPSSSSARTVVAFVGVRGAVLDGFRVTCGQGAGDINSDPAASSPGGGIYVNASEAVVSNCDIVNNRGWLLVVNNSVRSSSGDGGGAFVRDSTVRFENCRFANNLVQYPISDGCGGGTPIVVGRAGHGAGMVVMYSNVDLVNCVFKSNAASNGIDALGCLSTHFMSSGTNGGSGGAIFGVGGNLMIDRCRFVGNTSGAGGAGGSWGGPCQTSAGLPGNGGAIFNYGATTIANSVFALNGTSTNGVICADRVGGLGSAIYSTGVLSISNTVFFGNNSPGSQGNLGTIFGSPSALTNCIFWENRNDAGFGVRAQVGLVNTDLIQHCIVHGLGQRDSNGNSGLDPSFVDPEGPDGLLGTDDDRFDLAIGSPAIDAGTNAVYQFLGGGPFDLAGNPRFFDVPSIPDTGAGTAPIIDIGPYEFSRCPVDLDNGSGTGTPDNAVTIDDLLYFLAAFESGAPVADLDNGTGTGVHDHAVTIEDLLFCLVHFEAGC